MIKILLVDDSDTEIMLLKQLISTDSSLQVIGIAKSGEDAIRQTALLKPDLITMDIEMPGINGIEATRAIMSNTPTPIVIISSRLNNSAINASFHALEAGALCVLEKPTNIFSPSFHPQQRHMLETLHSMAEIKVIKRRFYVKKDKNSIIPNKQSVVSPHSYEIVAIGTSIGGPQALRVIFSELPDNFPMPIVVVQHMSAGFIEGYARWLSLHTTLQIKCATDNELLTPGTVYFAPDNYHLMVISKNNKLYAHLEQSPAVSGFCPSATVLFESVARHCGSRAIGIILTGMGNDGAVGLLEMKKQQAHTLTQDAKSAIVFGMAGVAQSLGAVDKVIELTQIASYLNKLVL